MICKFIYRDFKCFKDAELPLENLTTLIGTNSSGKTNAIEGMMILSELVTGMDLSIILDGSKNNNAGIRGASQGCARSKGDAFSLGCVVRYNDYIDLLYEITINVKERTVVEEEKLTEISYKEAVNSQTQKSCGNRKIIFSTKPSSHDSGNITVSINNGRQGRNPDITCIKSFAVISQIASKLSTETKYGKTAVDYCIFIINELKSILYLSPEPSLMRSYSNIGDDTLRVNGSNLSSVLYKLCDTAESKEKLLQFMKKLPENEVEGISFGHGSLNDVILFLKERYGKTDTVEEMSAMQLSDGTLRCLAIIAAMLSENEGGTIVIEEIDNGIHPGRAKELIHVLSQLGAKRSVDLVFSTHNPTLLNALSKEEMKGVSLIYRSEESGEGCIVSLLDMNNLPVLLASGKLGDVFADDKILHYAKTANEKKDFSWLGVE